MKGGDWNDGMNKVGGESVWLGFFLCTVLSELIPVSTLMGDVSGANRYRSIRNELLLSCEKHFDGEKYKRAYYVNGTAVGGDSFIDVIPQAFSVFASSDKSRSKTALETAYNRLYDAESSTFALLDPPFSRSHGDDPGYISTYPDGMRENGGQYTHAAVWGAMAMAEVGMVDKAWEVLCSINPARISSAENRYLGEPYFLAGDVCSRGRHKGRCGWSIYTGSSGWFFSAVFVTLLGFTINGDCFTITPRLSSNHPSFILTLTYRDTFYTVVASVGEQNRWVLDGKEVNNLFYFDKNRHYLEITVEISDEMR